MGNTNSKEMGQSTDAHQDKSNSSSTTSIHHKTTPLDSETTVQPPPPPPPPPAPFHSPLPSIQEDNQKIDIPQIVEPTKAVPVSTGKKSGWVSSTGGASPWYGSLSSSASSNRRASISGPYYRTRGMSVTRDSENDEEYMIQPTLELGHESNQRPSQQSQPQQLQQPQPQPQQPQPQPQQGVPTIITWSQGGHQVYVTGTFNGWKHKIKLIKSTHDFNAIIELPPGTHRLKFIVDDEWKCSNEMETATDPDGNLVNYLQVLDDEEEQEDEEDELGYLSSMSSLPDHDDYTNLIPPELLQLATQQKEETTDQQKKSRMDWEKKQPPSLPPHLEKVVLNSTTVSEEDNSVLHEPNHVTLNHLYACSIKDNVMALATTSRYRKKYVTTMYYRPVMTKEQEGEEIKQASSSS